MMSYRIVLGLSVTLFLLVGAIGWAANMPKPAALVGETISNASLPGPTRGAETTTAVSPSIGVIDPQWLQKVSDATTIPIRVLQAYATAAAEVDREQPRCKLGWNTLAAVGYIESEHGSHGGAHIGTDGNLIGTIIGPRLDGTSFAAVPDTDQGKWDGDTRWDHAVGPLQFLPHTWATQGLDGNGDGVADPNNIDDAAYTAANYLCAGGRDLTTAGGWSDAVLSYNNDVKYLEEVRSESALYATKSDG